MSAIQKFSAQVIDYAERLSKMADAAEGKRPRADGSARRWFLLPAAGAAVYAVGRSDFFTRRARGVVDDAKSFAAELPDDLMSRVRQTSGGSTRAPAPRRSGSNSTRRNRTRATKSTRARTGGSGRTRR